MEIEKQLLPLTFVTIMIMFMLPFVLVVPSVGNPFDTLTSALAFQTSNYGPSQAGTINQQDPTNISPTQARNIGCGGSIAAGAVGGAIVGSFFAGIGAIPGAGVGALIGGITGCAILPAVSPNTIQSFGQSIQGIANSAGIGGIVTLLGQIIGILNALIQFIPSIITYQLAAFSVDPVINLIMLPVESYTLMLWGLYFVRNTRGSEG